MALNRAIVACGKPVFGICRRLQPINVTFGGTLFQDIAAQHPASFQHREGGRHERHHHVVGFVPGTHLAWLFAGVQGHPEFHEPDRPVTLDNRPSLDDFLAAALAARG